MHDERLRKVLGTAAVVVFFLVFVLSLTKPLTDPDVFWHLKTGEWMWQHKTLPDKDPFSFTISPSQYETTARATFILKQYWLAQLIMYGFYHLGGFYGIVAFRCIIYLLIGLILYYWMGRKGVSRINRLLFLVPVVCFSIFVLGERPNNLSFLFAVIVVYLLEDLKNSSNSLNGLNRLRLVSLPLVLLLWANMHGGFILGDAIIILYLIAEALKKVFKRNETGKNTKHGSFFTICIVSIIISFANPNAYKAIPTIFELEGTYYSVSISELMSPIKYAEKGDYNYLLIIGAVILIFLPRIRKVKLNAALLISFLVFLAMTRVRYIPFLVFLSVPFITDAWKGVYEGAITRIKDRYESCTSFSTHLFYIHVLIMSIFVIFLFISQMRFTVFKKPVISSFLPEATVEFIRAEKPEPEIFNDYGWGGYLIWSLYPEYRVFIDGRGLVQSDFVTYNKALSGSVSDISGVSEWRAVFNKYRVNAVILPSINRIGGGFIRLVRRLVEDDEWSLVFTDKDALLFIKNTEKNREIIRKYSKPKILAYGKALEQAELYRYQHLEDWKSYATLGEINLYLGSPGAALVNFEYALRLNPSLQSTSFGRLIEKLKTGQDYTRYLDRIF